MEKDLLSQIGRIKLEYAIDNMPALKIIRKEFLKEKPLENIKIGVALHIEKKTGVLLKTLAEGGAIIYATSCNPLTTDDSIVATLLENNVNIHIRAASNQTKNEYYQNLEWILSNKPDLLIDDGGDLIVLLISKFREHIPNIIGGCEETTTGIRRLKRLELENKLPFPVISVNDAYSKHLFDNRFGTGQSVCTAVLQITNLSIKGKTVVVVGYGPCGKGIAETFRGFGAKVVVVEVGDRLLDMGPSGFHRALEAYYSGYQVMSMDEACKIGDIFITATGNKHVISAKHIKSMKDGVILANAGHYDIEIDVEALRMMSCNLIKINSNMDMFVINNKKRVYLLSEGRLVNLVRPTGLGHPIEIMDGSFALQAKSCEYLVKHQGKLDNRIHRVPLEIDDEIAKTILESHGIFLEKMTNEQVEYLSNWKEGT